MESRHVYVRDASVFRKNGVKVGRNDLPSVNSLRYFFSEILSTLINSKNCPNNHVCSELCTMPILIHIGSPRTDNLMDACPEDLERVIYDMEHLLSVFVFDNDDYAAIRAISLKILPCIRNLVILNSAIYL